MTDHGNRGFAEDALRAMVDRVERIREEQKGLSDDVADLYNEAKGAGFDVKALKEVIKRRARDPDKARELEEVVSLYMSAMERELKK